MPFNWNLTRIKQQPIFVHEEMRLPKSWKGLGDNTQFNALVNGQPLSGRSLAIDPFSFPDAMVVHYLINKNDVLRLAQQVNAACCLLPIIIIMAEVEQSSIILLD